MSKERKLLERIIRHFEKQGKYARNNGGCVYRKIDEDGHIIRCALGCLIPKSKYNPTIEDATLYSTMTVTVGRVEILEEILKELKLYEHREFLAEMQKLHDDYALGRSGQYNRTFDDYLAALRSKREVYT